MIVIIIKWGSYHEIKTLHSGQKQNFLGKCNHTECLKLEKETKSDLVLPCKRNDNFRASKTPRISVALQAKFSGKSDKAPCPNNEGQSQDWKSRALASYLVYLAKSFIITLPIMYFHKN